MKLLLHLIYIPFLFCEPILETSSGVIYEELMSKSPINLQLAIKNGLNTICMEPSTIDSISFFPLEGGFSSSNLFTFTAENKKYVLRILNPKTLNNPALTQNKRMREIITHQVAVSLDLAPKIAYTDPDALILIMAYIDGHTLYPVDFRNKEFLLLLGSNIKKLHQNKTQLPAKRTLTDRAIKHYQLVNKKGIALPCNFKEIYESYEANDKLLSQNNVLCHGDLNPNNIIVQNGKPLFIDFQEATYDHPLSDIGYLSFTSGMNDAQTKTLLRGYLEREPSLAEFKLTKFTQARCCFLTSITWFDFSEKKEAREKPIHLRIQKLDQLLASPTLKLASEYIRTGDIVNPRTAPSEEVQKFALGFLKEYLIRIKELESYSTIISNESKNDRASGNENLAFFKVFD